MSVVNLENMAESELRKLLHDVEKAHQRLIAQGELSTMKKANRIANWLTLSVFVILFLFVGATFSSWRAGNSFLKMALGQPVVPVGAHWLHRSIDYPTQPETLQLRREARVMIGFYRTWLSQAGRSYLIKAQNPPHLPQQPQSSAARPQGVGLPAHNDGGFP